MDISSSMSALGYSSSVSTLKQGTTAMGQSSSAKISMSEEAAAADSSEQSTQVLSALTESSSELTQEEEQYDTDGDGTLSATEQAAMWQAQMQEKLASQAEVNKLSAEKNAETKASQAAAPPSNMPEGTAEAQGAQTAQAISAYEIQQHKEAFEPAAQRDLVL